MFNEVSYAIQLRVLYGTTRNMLYLQLSM